MSGTVQVVATVVTNGGAGTPPQYLLTAEVVNADGTVDRDFNGTVTLHQDSSTGSTVAITSSSSTAPDPATLVPTRPGTTITDGITYTLDAAGNSSVAYTTTTTIAPTMTGTLTAQAVDGMATFTDVEFNLSGTYAIRATDDAGDASGPAVPVTVDTANPLQDKVVITQQPTQDTPTGTFSVTAAVVDQQGDPVSVDPSAHATLHLASGPDGAQLSGPTVSADGGVVGTVNADGTITFSGLSVNVSGQYQFKLLTDQPVAASVVTDRVDLSGPPINTLTPVLRVADGVSGMLILTPTSAKLVDGTPAQQSAAPTKAQQAASARAAKKAAAQQAKAERRAAHAALVAQRQATRAAVKAAKQAQANGAHQSAVA